MGRLQLESLAVAISMEKLPAIAAASAFLSPAMAASLPLVPTQTMAMAQIRAIRASTNGTAPAWNQLGSDIDGEAASDSSSLSVSLSSDGTIVAIGAQSNDGNGSNSGHTRIYQWDSASSSWNQLGSDIDGEAANDYSGVSAFSPAMAAPSPLVPTQTMAMDLMLEHVRVFDLGNQITLAISVLNTLDGNTSGTVNASNITTLTGAAADLNTAYDSSGIGNLNSEAITLTDTSLTVSSLRTLDGNTSGTINANTVSTFLALPPISTPPTTPLASATSAMRPSPSLTPYSPLPSSTPLTATSGTVNANTVATLSGAAYRPQHRLRLLQPSASSATKPSPSPTPHSQLQSLNTLDGNTTGTINANTVSTLSGAADLNTAYDSSSISNLGNEDVTLSDTTLAVSVLNTLDGNTSGTIDANTVTTHSGAAADLNTAYASSGITGLGNEAVTLTDTSSPHRSLTPLTATPQAPSMPAPSPPSLALQLDLNTAYDSSGISNLGDEAVTLTDTSLAAPVLNTLDGNTSGVINQPAASPPSPVLQLTSTPPTAPTASQVGITRTSPSPTPRSPHQPSTPSTAKPPAPSTPIPSPPDWRRGSLNTARTPPAFQVLVMKIFLSQYIPRRSSVLNTLDKTSTVDANSLSTR